MTDADDHDRDESGAGDEYDPFEYVPDRIDQITASGLEQLYEALNEQNKARQRSISIEQQAVILWDLVEKGTIDLNVTSPDQGADQ